MSPLTNIHFILVRDSNDVSILYLKLNLSFSAMIPSFEYESIYINKNKTIIPSIIIL